MLRIPRLSIFATAEAMAASSTARNCAALISPLAH
jgi:hypothetical protein